MEGAPTRRATPPARSISIIALASLLQPGESSDESGNESEGGAPTTARVLKRAAADTARLHALLDDDDAERVASPPGAVSVFGRDADSGQWALADEGGSAPNDAPDDALDDVSNDELLSWCRAIQDLELEEDLKGFVCPECLYVADDEAGLVDHYSTEHGALWDENAHNTWKARAGRNDGGDGYRFGDVSRAALSAALGASQRTRRRVARRFRRLRRGAAESDAAGDDGNDAAEATDTAAEAKDAAAEATDAAVEAESLELQQTGLEVQDSPAPRRLGALIALGLSGLTAVAIVGAPLTLAAAGPCLGRRRSTRRVAGSNRVSRRHGARRPRSVVVAPRRHERGRRTRQRRAWNARATGRGRRRGASATGRGRLRRDGAATTL